MIQLYLMKEVAQWLLTHLGERPFFYKNDTLEQRQMSDLQGSFDFIILVTFKACCYKSAEQTTL